MMKKRHGLLKYILVVVIALVIVLGMKFFAGMPSAFIKTARGYPAMPLAEQLVHRRCVRPGPLVLRSALLKYPTPTTDRDRTVSRRSEPSSRTTLIGGQPNPWDLLQAPGCDEPTSRCQTSPSLWTLGGDQPVIPRVAFIR